MWTESARASNQSVHLTDLSLSVFPSRLIITIVIYGRFLSYHNHVESQRLSVIVQNDENKFQVEKRAKKKYWKNEMMKRVLIFAHPFSEPFEIGAFIKHKCVYQIPYCTLLPWRVCVCVAVRALEHYGFPCAVAYSCARAQTLTRNGIVNVSVTSEMSFTFFLFHIFLYKWFII